MCNECRYEAMALTAGASRVVTIEHNELRIQHPVIQVEGDGETFFCNVFLVWRNVFFWYEFLL